MMIMAFPNCFSQFTKLSSYRNLPLGQVDTLLLSVVTSLTSVQARRDWGTSIKPGP